MTKRNIMTGIVSLSLLITGTAPTQAATPENQSPRQFSFITRELVGQNDGLSRYQYVDESGNTLDITEDSTDTAQKKRAASLPSSYDARTENVVTDIKDQGYTGACWSFGAIKSLESSSIRKGITDLENTDFSESHLAWYTYNGVSDSSHPLYGDTANTQWGYSIYEQGGNPINAIFTLANWWGAAKEEDAPFTANTIQEMTNMEASMSVADESLRTKNTVHLTRARFFDEADLSVKKQAIMDNGSMSVSLYFNDRDVYNAGGEYSVYQNLYNSDYANHVVTIIGWDDDFSSFHTMPAQGKGAWLIANSYNTDWGNKGFYWVSYYDTSLCEFATFEAEPTDIYDTNYQYDGAGYNSGLVGEKEDIIFSNIFTNTSNSPQRISAAALHTITDGQKYEISIYRNLKSKNPTNGEYVAKCTTQGVADYNGYHTVPLKDSIIVAPGESFSVVATFFHQNNTVYVPIEGLNSWNSSLSFGSQEGQSFIYDTESNSWIDTTKYPSGLRTQNYNNVCLKAFGKNVSQEEYDQQQADYSASTPTTTPGNNSPVQNNPEPGESDNKIPATRITVNKNKITMGKGEKVTLAYSLTPSNTTDTLVFRTSNSSVASVNNRGVVTGKNTGSAKITLSSSSGKTATVTVNVKKAPSSVKLKAGKKKLKKGKTTSLKVTLSKNSASYKITYQSSNKKIATVNSSGIVKAKKKGKVKIKVKTFNGKTSSVTITVK